MNAEGAKVSLRARRVPWRPLRLTLRPLRLALFTGSYLTAPNPRFGRLACTGDDSSQSRKACASALRPEFFITTAYCSIAGYCEVGTRTYVPISLKCGELAAVREIRPSCAFPDSTNCAVCAIFSPTTKCGATASYIFIFRSASAAALPYGAC